MSSNNGSTWEDLFRQRSQTMKEHGASFSSEPSEQGLISLQADRKCENCGEKGVYTGIAIFSGHLFETINADYCPSCDHIHPGVAAKPLLTRKPNSFLPIMAQRLMDYPELEAETIPGEPCPVCQAITRTFEIPRGSLDRYAHHWSVCTTGCGWQGDYHPIL